MEVWVDAKDEDCTHMGYYHGSLDQYLLVLKYHNTLHCTSYKRYNTAKLFYRNLATSIKEILTYSPSQTGKTEQVVVHKSAVHQIQCKIYA